MKKIQPYLNQFNLSVSSIDPVPESYSSEVYSILLKNGEKVILKIPYNSAKLHRELEILQLLVDKLPVPWVLDFWEGSEEFAGALLLSHLAGDPIQAKVDLELAYQMGELLARLHQIPMQQFDLVKSEPHDWWKSMRLVFDSWIKECEAEVSLHIIEKCKEVFAFFYKDLPIPDGPCVIHMDYRPGNILVLENRITGLIDFESTRGGSADADFTKIKLYVWDLYPGTKTEFIRGYQSVRPLPDIENVLPFYLFYNTVGGLAWCIRRNQKAGPFYDENMKLLKKYFL